MVVGAEHRSPEPGRAAILGREQGRKMAQTPRPTRERLSQRRNAGRESDRRRLDACAQGAGRAGDAGVWSSVRCCRQRVMVVKFGGLACWWSQRTCRNLRSAGLGDLGWEWASTTARETGYLVRAGEMAGVPGRGMVQAAPRQAGSNSSW